MPVFKRQRLPFAIWWTEFLSKLNIHVVNLAVLLAVKILNSEREIDNSYSHIPPYLKTTPPTRHCKPQAKQSHIPGDASSSTLMTKEVFEQPLLKQKNHESPPLLEKAEPSWFPVKHKSIVTCFFYLRTTKQPALQNFQRLQAIFTPRRMETAW